MTVGNRTRLPAPPFLSEAFPPFWSDWIRAQAEVKGTPPDYVAGPLLSAAGALIGNARWAMAWLGWVTPPVIWTAAVGLPSSAKSPAADAVNGVVRQLETLMGEDWPERKREHLTAIEAARATREKWKSEVAEAVKKAVPAPEMPAAATEPEPIQRPRIIVNDTSQEKMAHLLAAHPKGLLHVRDELSGWLGGFDRYGGGGERAFWLEAYEGRSYSVDRVKQGDESIRIPHLSVCVTGGIQPDKLVDLLLSGSDDGMAARFLYFWPEPIKPIRPIRTADTAAAHDALRRLLNLPLQRNEQGELTPSFVPLSAEAANEFQSWREQHAAGEEAISGRLLGYHGKMPGVVLRLALIIEYLNWCAAPPRPDPDQIGMAALMSALALVEDYLKPMAARVFADASLSEAERDAATIARWVLREKPSRINLRQLRRRGLPNLREAEKAQAAVKVLEDADWARPLHERSGGGRGRTRSDYEINLRVYGDAK
jgi:hypothetical protein